MERPDRRIGIRPLILLSPTLLFFETFWNDLGKRSVLAKTAHMTSERTVSDNGDCHTSTPASGIVGAFRY
jgi:hypothetical protein